MSGISANRGFSYQNKIILFHLLDFLQKGELLECRFEVKIDSESEIDIVFLTTYGGATKYNFYEVKDKKNLKGSEIKEILKNFHKLFLSISIPKHFYLIHSTQIFGSIGNFHKNSNDKNKFIKANVPKSTNEFVNCVSAKQIIDSNQCGIIPGNLDFYSKWIIEEILRTKFTIKRHGYADRIYQAIAGIFENLIRAEEQRLEEARKNIRFDGKENWHTVDLRSVFSGRDSFVDCIAKRRKVTFEKAEAMFSTKFNLNFKIKSTASYSGQ